MRSLALLSMAVLGSCATTAPPPPAPGGGGVCRNDSLARFAGREATSEIGSEILSASGGKILRWVQPGMAVTMDYREDRVTVWIAAANNRIERATCG